MEGHIKIDFVYTEGAFNYSDALWLPEDHTFSDAEIEAMKKARFDNWMAVISAPPPGPSNEEIEANGTPIVSGEIPPVPDEE